MLLLIYYENTKNIFFLITGLTINITSIIYSTESPIKINGLLIERKCFDHRYGGRWEFILGENGQNIDSHIGDLYSYKSLWEIADYIRELNNNINYNKLIKFERNCSGPDRLFHHHIIFNDIFNTQINTLNVNNNLYNGKIYLSNEPLDNLLCSWKQSAPANFDKAQGKKFIFVNNKIEQKFLTIINANEKYNKIILFNYLQKTLSQATKEIPLYVIEMNSTSFIEQISSIIRTDKKKFPYFYVTLSTMMIIIIFAIVSLNSIK